MQLRGINQALLFLDREMAQQVEALVAQARLLECDAWNLNKGKEREQSCSLVCTCAHQHNEQKRVVSVRLGIYVGPRGCKLFPSEKQNK